MDVLPSISRLAQEVAEPPILEAAAKVRDILGTYREASDLIQVGAYTPGTDPRVDQAVSLMPRIETFLKQSVSERTLPAETRARLLQLVMAPQSMPPGAMPRHR